MKSSAVIASLFALASTVLAARGTAQTAPDLGSEKMPQNFAVVLPAATCPVTLRALQGSATGLLKVRDAIDMTGPSQRIHLIVSETGASHVVGATVVVRGFSGKNQTMPAISTSGEQGDLSKRLEVKFAPDGEKAVAADLVLPGFTSVRSIQIQSIGYQDGARWAVAGRACRVAPDPFMLVAGR